MVKSGNRSLYLFNMHADVVTVEVLGFASDLAEEKSDSSGARAAKVERAAGERSSAPSELGLARPHLLSPGRACASQRAPARKHSHQPLVEQLRAMHRAMSNGKCMRRGLTGFSSTERAGAIDALQPTTRSTTPRSAASTQNAHNLPPTRACVLTLSRCYHTCVNT